MISIKYYQIKKDLKVHKDKALIIKGTRNKSDTLQNIPTKPNNMQNNYIIPLVIASLYPKQYDNKN